MQFVYISIISASALNSLSCRPTHISKFMLGRLLVFRTAVVSARPPLQLCPLCTLHSTLYRHGAVNNDVDYHFDND